MDHLAAIAPADRAKSLHVRATGRFYTPEAIGRPLARDLVGMIDGTPESASLIDPFCGDGRLVVWLLEEAASRGIRPAWSVHLWDIDGPAVSRARSRVEGAIAALGLSGQVQTFVGDSLARGATEAGRFDALITNPPWERLKPDRRDQDELQPGAFQHYYDGLRKYDAQLAAWFPLSRPTHRFSGWGTNLARVGTELSLKLVRDHGVVGIVSPASLLGDQDSIALRKHLLSAHRVRAVSVFPAEAHLFDGVDQPSITVAAIKCRPSESDWLQTTVFDSRGLEAYRAMLPLHQEQLEQGGYLLPTGFGIQAADLLPKLGVNAGFGALEGSGPGQLWAGRELDETGYQAFLSESGSHLFVKGRMIERWTVCEPPSRYVNRSMRRIPPAADHLRIAWRDVSRPNQKRRVQATLIPAGWVAGNSLGTAYYRDDNSERLKALLAVMNSLAFEFQVRARLSTGHVSLTTIRQVSVPPLRQHAVRELAIRVDRRLAGDLSAEAELEVLSAKLYGLRVEEFERLIACFAKISSAESRSLLARWADAPDLRDEVD